MKGMDLLREIQANLNYKKVIVSVNDGKYSLYHQNTGYQRLDTEYIVKDSNSLVQAMVSGCQILGLEVKLKDDVSLCDYISSESNEVMALEEELTSLIGEDWSYKFDTEHHGDSNPSSSEVSICSRNYSRISRGVTGSSEESQANALKRAIETIKEDPKNYIFAYNFKKGLGGFYYEYSVFDKMNEEWGIERLPVDRFVLFRLIQKISKVKSKYIWAFYTYSDNLKVLIMTANTKEDLIRRVLPYCETQLVSDKLK